MSGLAEICLDLNISVTGSDLNHNAKIDNLNDRGVTVYANHDASHVNQAQCVVYSSAVAENNPELVEAKIRNLPLLHRSEFLSLLTQEKQTIVVAGTHGKTTTTALIIHMLKSLSLDIGFYIGGNLVGPKRSGGWGSDSLFVIEADESDGSFLNFSPYISIITNIDHDHLDHYGNYQNLVNAFQKFVLKTDSEGFAIVNWALEDCRHICETIKDRVYSFSNLIGSDIRYISFEDIQGTLNYQIVVGNEVISSSIPLIGKHNIENLCAAFGVALALGLHLKKVADSIRSFKGVERRLEYLYKSDDYILIHDYAHNPGKIQSIITSVRNSWPQHRILVVFQPHRFSRLETLYPQFVQSFASADLVFVNPIYAAGETPITHLTHHKLAEDISKNCSCEVVAVDSYEQLESAIIQQKVKKSVILTLGAGDINLISNRLAESTFEKTQGVHS